MLDEAQVIGAAPKIAIVLAAGSGERLSGAAPLKPLLEVGGLSLVERTVLTLRRAGIEHFRVVVGARGDRVVAAMRALKRLRGLDLAYVECPDWQRGNGVSLACGAAGLTESFVVSVADHVTDGNSARRLVAAATARPATPKLATDPHPERVFDLDDATKVLTAEGRIVAIGKQLRDYDQVDTGLFYFPAGSGARLASLRDAGAAELSDFVRTLAAATGGFEAVPGDGDFWQDVDTPAMAREAERRLLATLPKPTDGPVSRYLNRPLSLRLTRLLARLDVSPNAVTTFVFLLSLAAALLAAGASGYGALALSGILFHAASVIDGCDGELSRYKLEGSRFGAWYDTLTDNVRYIAMFAALGVYSFRHTHESLYLWALGLFLLVSVYFVSMMARRVIAEGAHGTNLLITERTAAFATGPAAGWYERIVWPLQSLTKQDVSAFVIMIALLLSAPAAMFWLGLLALVVMTIQVRRALRHGEGSLAAGSAAAPNGSFATFLAGTAVLGLLLSRAPLAEITQTLSDIGPRVLPVFGIALLWLLLNTLSLSAIVDHGVGLRTLLHNRLVGEAINNLVPLAGLAGEPYKIKHLSSFVPLDVATHAVVSDKLINGISGFVFFAGAGSAAVALVGLPDSLRLALIGLSIAAALAALAVSTLVLSAVPTRALVRAMRKLGIVANDRDAFLSARTFFTALAFNVAGRLASLLEMLALFHLLGMSTDATHLVAVAAVLSATSIVFFLIPQGIGVSEAGVTGAFLLLGLPVHLGVAFALLRRARILFWALVGLVLYAGHALVGRGRAQLELELTR